MKKHIPNTVTLLNLTTGAAGIIMLYNGNLAAASAMIFLAAVFDFLDGFLARLLGVHSVIGKSLDSLADVVSFGLLPGLIVYVLQKKISPGEGSAEEIFAFTSLLIPALSGLRLAIFDNDEEQKYSFKGLPTPANALFFGGTALAYSTHGLSVIPLNGIILFVLTIILSLLLVSKIPMFAFKFTNYKVKPNIVKYLFILSAILLILFFRFEGIALSVILYILISLVKPT